MEGPPFLVHISINENYSTNALVDTGCLTYGMIDDRFARKCRLPRIKIRPRSIQAIDAVTTSVISEVVQVGIDVAGHRRTGYFYVAPNIEGYKVVLGLPWMQKEEVTLNLDQSMLHFKRSGIQVYSQKEKELNYDHCIIGAAGFRLLTTGKQKRKNQVFSASLKDINKALGVKQYTDPASLLPDWVAKDYLKAFDRKEAEKLPPHRPGVDHEITLEVGADKKAPAAPWGPLYNMSRDELLVLRKTLNEHLDKGFIRVSNSPAAAPVLFVRKPGGGLRFCCDYRALNKLTRKDRYPLPLIQETLNRIGKARWFTKLDVIAAFHKIRIREGDEWMTAFRTRFGLYEWLVTPFGLANAPSTFQRYINWTLRDFLDDFVSAYVDDVLVFTEGSKEDHRKQVCKVLEKLQQAGLHLDVDKCEFEVQSTKYLGFIIEAGKGISMDPAKVSAIQEWKAPTTAKGVLGFLGFANFYRRFIKDFSKLSSPLHALTKKDVKYQWNKEADDAFEALKKAFVSASVLTQFDPDRETVVETDSSGYCVGGILSQWVEGVLRPCAYYSKKNQPAECNYEIYDKEMLAIIRCLEEWEAELKSVGEFKILTDHKNLEYFTTLRKLSERQMRWQLILSKFRPIIQYRPGKLGAQPDALTRREQDLPVSLEDERLQYRMAQLIPDGMIRNNCIRLCPARTITRVVDDLKASWEKASDEDPDFTRIVEAVRNQDRMFPKDLKTPVKLSISDCSLNEEVLLYRKRRWVPNSEALRTRLIQEIHDSTITAHPGRDATVALVAKTLFWPDMLNDIRRFVRNCTECGRTKPWRDRKNGLLKPLPVPCQQWKEISIDFVGPLPISKDCTMLMVITDRLSKGVILEACSSIDADYIAKLFLSTFYRRHGTPKAIVTDRGTQFTSKLWKRVCQLLKIERRISTSFHPETDGATERANTEVEKILRLWVNQEQDDWADWLPMVELALNNRRSSTTGTSSFFMGHGFDVEPLELFEEPVPSIARTPIQKADMIALKIKEVTEMAQVSMSAVQQEQEAQANKHRKAPQAYQKGDWVWLNLKNIKTDKSSKKMDDKSAKYQVIGVVGPQSYRLNVEGVHNVFNVDLLRPAASDPLPSQQVSDYQPPSIVVDGEEEWKIECIDGARLKRVRNQNIQQYRVKWEGYVRRTWEPASSLQDTVALDEYLARTV